MKRFLQIHTLTPYTSSNLNSDEQGRPKMASIGGCPRIRISSQCLKRTWRTSPYFISELKDHLGVRTRKISQKINEKLSKAGIENASEIIQKVFYSFSSVSKEKKDKGCLSTMVFMAQEEQCAIDRIIQKYIDTNEMSDVDIESLKNLKIKSADIALFGRMIAETKSMNVQSSIQVAHSFTTHSAMTEIDYFSAVDDLSEKNVRGSGHIGNKEFSSGVFYGYVCLNRELLHSNLQNDKSLTEKTIQALVKSIVSVAPSGKQSGFANFPRPIYALVQSGDGQPCSLSSAFFKPIENNLNIESKSVEVLEAYKNKLISHYDELWDSEICLNVLDKGNKTTLNQILEFCIK